MPDHQFSYQSDDDYPDLRAAVIELSADDRLIVPPPPDADMLFADRLAYRINDDSDLTGVHARADNAQTVEPFGKTTAGRVIITKTQS